MMSKKHDWISIRDKYPPLWKKVLMNRYSSDPNYIAYRTIFGNWKFESGYSDWISGNDKWTFIE